MWVSLELGSKLTFSFVVGKANSTIAPLTQLLCELKEWLVCNYVWHSSLYGTVCWLVTQELVLTPEQAGGPKSTLLHLVASVSSAIYWNLKMTVLWPVMGLIDYIFKMLLML